MGESQDAVQLAGTIVNSVYFVVYGATASYTLWRYSKILDLFTVALMSVYIIAHGCKHRPLSISLYSKSSILDDLSHPKKGLRWRQRHYECLSLGLRISH